MKTKEDSIINVISVLFMLIVALISIVPIVMIVTASFTSESSLIQYGYSVIPKEFSLDAYRMVFANNATVFRAYVVTIIVAVVGTTMSVIFSTQFAYSISRKNFAMKGVLSFAVYFTMLFSGGQVPMYILITRYLHLKNNLLAIILPNAVSGWNIFMLRTYISALPDELIEAAKIDGASEFEIFYKIIVHLAVGGIMTVTLTTALGYWNDWMSSLLYISDPKLYSLQYLLQTLLGKVEFMQKSSMQGLSGGDIPSETLRMATCVVSIGPMVCIFFFFQKYFVKGLTVGAVKG